MIKAEMGLLHMNTFGHMSVISPVQGESGVNPYPLGKWIMQNPIQFGILTLGGLFLLAGLKVLDDAVSGRGSRLRVPLGAWGKIR